MTNDELKQLQDDESWDASQASLRSPVRNARAVVSVAFAREDLDRVSARAEELGMKTSEFIRHAALESAAASGGGSKSTITSVSAPGAFRSSYQRTSEGRSDSRFSTNEPEPAYVT